MGNGEIISCNGICRQVSITLNNLVIKVDFYPFELGNVDAVLEVKWLASLDTVQANWNHMFLKFQHGGKWFKIQGETRPLMDAVSLRVMSKMMRADAPMFFCQLAAKQTVASDSRVLQPEVQSVRQI